MPPVAPMLAKPVDAIPSGDFLFEPKWDGFRSIVFRDRDEVEIGSRNERPMTRYFPELVTAFLSELPAPVRHRRGDRAAGLGRRADWTSRPCNCDCTRPRAG